MRILIVEDSEPTRELIARSLSETGIEVVEAERVASGIEHAMRQPFDVIVLDLMLPDGDGLHLCRELRGAGVRTPILCLSARAAVGDRVEGLDAGADDYLKKPFALAELRARVRALARREGAAPVRVLALGETHIDFGARRLLHGGGEVPLTEREWLVLEVLAARQGRVVERREILDLVWHDAGAWASDSLEVILSRLRRKLTAAGASCSIRTVRGAGLIFEAGP